MNTEAPKLSGTPTLGQQLSCTTGAWKNNPASFAYAWLRDGALIAGQTGSVYKVQSTDWGHSLSCRVTAANAVGEYTVTSLPSGSYVVSFSSYTEFTFGPYLSQYFNEKLSSSEANRVAVTAPSTTGGVNGVMRRGGVISGKVTNGLSSAPVANVGVCAFEAGASIDFEYLLYEGCSYTNANGEYTVVGLQTGSYDLILLPPVEEGGLAEYVDAFYNAKYTEGEAEAVAVTAGATTVGVNPVLLPAALGGAISGHVASAAGGKASLKGISVCAKSSLGYVFGRCVYTDASGNYTITGLMPGSYNVEYWAGPGASGYVYQYYNGKAKESEATSVSVSLLKTASGVNAELTPGGTISGTVTDASTHAPVAQQEVCADEIGGAEDGECAPADANGKYAIPDLPTGGYKVFFERGYTPGSTYVEQYYAGVVSSGEATEVHVTAPSTTSNVNAEMRVGGQITGTVIDAATHVPIAHAEACAFSASTFPVCATTETSGGYVIRQLLTGMYTVKFYALSEAGDYLTQYYNGKTAASEATKVSVTVGGTTAGVNAELHPGGQIHGLTTDAVTHMPIGSISACASDSSIGASGCVSSNSVAGSGVAASNSIVVPKPDSSFSQTKKPVFDAKAKQLDFFFKITNAGTMSWSLFFKNADVGYADSLGISAAEGSVAAAARRKAKPCKKGYVKRRSRCVRVLVPFSSGSKAVGAGTVEIKVPVGAKALKALRAGHALHVSGTFKFQSSLGGAPVSHPVSALVHLPKKAKHSKHRHK